MILFKAVWAGKECDEFVKVFEEHGKKEENCKYIDFAIVDADQEGMDVSVDVSVGGRIEGNDLSALFEECLPVKEKQKLIIIGIIIVLLDTKTVKKKFKLSFISKYLKFYLLKFD